MVSTFVISEGDIHGIATILIEDAELVQSKQKFYNSMGLPYGEFVDIERRAFFSGSSESYVLFNLILTKWIQLKGNDATLEILIEKLREENFNLSASKLMTWTPDLTPAGAFPALSAGVFGRDLPTNGWLSEPVTLPSVNTIKIYPRTQEGMLITATIKESLERNNTICIHGPNGYGKSTAAISYAFLNYRKYSYMIWLEAKTVSQLNVNIKELAHKLGIPTAIRLNLHSEQMTTKSLGQLVEEVYRKLKRKKCLIVFDNVGIAQQIQLYLPGPQYTNDFHVVLTSRLPIPYLKNFALNVFVPEEAVHFLCKELGITSDQLQELELVKKIAEEVGYVPLALQLLILPEIRNITSYLKSSWDNQEAVVTPSVQFHNELPEYPEGVYRFFEVSLKAAECDLFNTFDDFAIATILSLLHIMALLNPDDIPYEIFNSALNSGQILPSLQAFVNHNILVKITRSGSGMPRDIIRMSKVWQKILQIRLQNYDTPVKVKIVKLGIEMGAKVQNDDTSQLRHPLWEYIAVKTSTLFESLDLMKLCWRNHYFDPHFCRGKIRKVHFFKLLFFRLVLNLREWCSHILIPCLIGVVLGRISVIGIHVDLWESLSIMLISIFGFVVFGSLLISLFESLIRLPGYNFFLGLMRFVIAMFALYVHSSGIILIPWLVFIIPAYNNDQEREKQEVVKRLIQLSVGSVLVIQGWFVMRLFPNVNGWKFWCSKILITFGTMNVVNGFIFIMLGKSDPCIDCAITYDLVNLFFSSFLTLTFYICVYKYIMPTRVVDNEHTVSGKT